MLAVHHDKQSGPLFSVRLVPHGDVQGTDHPKQVGLGHGWFTVKEHRFLAGGFKIALQAEAGGQGVGVRNIVVLDGNGTMGEEITQLHFDYISIF